jgi:hypothetical protein
VALALVAGAGAREPAPGLVPQTVDEPAAAPPGLLELPRESLSPRLLEIRDLLEGRDKQLEALSARFRDAADDAEAMRIQREIHDLKSGTEVELLKIQLRYARREENHEAVVRLEETLARVEAGPVILAPEPRSRPDANR